jgi:ribonuclease P protein component
MLVKQNRIRLNKDFDHIFKVGQSFYGKFFGIKASPSVFLETRLGVMVSTKVSKIAPKRNKLKRQVKSIIKLELDKFKSPVDLVVITLPSALGVQFEDLKKDLLGLLKRLRIYK